MPTGTRRTRSVKRSSVPAEFKGRAARTTTSPAAPEPQVSQPTQEIIPFQTPGFITKAQWEFVCDLLDKRDLLKSPGFFDMVNAMDAGEYATYIAWLKDRMQYTTRAKASETITALKALPNKPREGGGSEPSKKVPDVPEGHYALRYPQDELNPVRFYKVTHGKDNRARGGKDWTGAIFLERFASDDTFSVKYRSAEYFRVLKEINADKLAAATLYGEEFERCCICNRGLTRRLSRELGIGPVCLRKHADVWGIDVEARIEETRSAIIARGDDPEEKLAKPRHRQHILDHA